jgi:hypothetical protein
MHERKVEDPEFYRNLYSQKEKGCKVDTCRISKSCILSYSNFWEIWVVI